MYVTAKITMTREKVMSIPGTAVAVQNEQTYVVVVENGKARRVKVRLGLRTKGYVELLTKLEPASDPAQQPRWIKFTGEESLVGANIGVIDDGQAIPTAK